MDDLILRWLLRELFSYSQEVDRLRARIRELEEQLGEHDRLRQEIKAV